MRSSSINILDENSLMKKIILSIKKYPNIKLKDKINVWLNVIIPSLKRDLLIYDIKLKSFSFKLSQEVEKYRNVRSLFLTSNKFDYYPKSCNLIKKEWLSEDVIVNIEDFLRPAPNQIIQYSQLSKYINNIPNTNQSNNHESKHVTKKQKLS